MAQINYNSGQTQQINDLKSYIDEYCRTNNIDPDIYTDYLDGKKNIDADILKDPAFQAYWQLAYLQLMEILNPSLIQSLQAEIGEVNFDALYARAGDETNEFFTKLIEDNPELLSFAALADGDSSTSPNQIRALVETALREEGPPPFQDDQARDLAHHLGMGSAYNWLIESEEGIRSTESNLMGALAEMDQELANLAELLRDGSITADEFKAKTDSLSQNRQVYLSMIQNLENAWSTMLEMMSDMVKSRNDLQSMLGRNLNVPA